ncbi:uncharacterized protein BYT42DRAFT_583398 [Radiomyces spectabilis]|uniref:uncharacterized protein n=1 Tax=Radiomyces spectabilis TaxID=64574 RepID=UPI00221F06DE|nr:uncharacterized protein BYT42DRAFT_583398 [Radiomyces spectabilis]KAI8370699.1 hypothetical protein BYT42DRAFT_583398 [Radiomyces spectabilis]
MASKIAACSFLNIVVSFVFRTNCSACPVYWASIICFLDGTDGCAIIAIWMFSRNFGRSFAHDLHFRLPDHLVSLSRWRFASCFLLFSSAVYLPFFFFWSHSLFCFWRSPGTVWIFRLYGLFYDISCKCQL